MNWDDVPKVDPQVERQADEEFSEQFKHGDNSKIIILSRKNILYGGKLMPIGHQDCNCTTFKLNIRNTFKCDGCYKKHKYNCSNQHWKELVWNDYSNGKDGLNYCRWCENFKNSILSQYTQQ